MVKNIPSVERSTKIRFGKNVPDSTDQAENTIVFNASNVHINADYAGSVYMTPLRVQPDLLDPKIAMLTYNSVTKEIMDSGVLASDLFNLNLEDVTINGNVTSNTIQFVNLDTGFITSGNVGISNSAPIHTLDVGSNLYIDDTGSNVLVVSGNVAVLRDMVIDGNLTVNGDTTVIYTENTTIKDALIELGQNNTSTDTTLDLGILMHRPDALSNVVVGYREGVDEFAIGYTDATPTDKTFTPKTDQDIDVHVYGRVLTEANVGIINTSPIHTLDVGSKLYVDEFGSNILVVRGNTNVMGDLTVDTDTLYVDSVANKVGIKTTSPDAELHVVGNAYVSSNLIVSGNTFIHSNVVVSGNTDVQSELNVAGNVYVSSNVVVSGNTDVQSELNVAGNVYVSSNTIITGNTDVQSELNVAGNVYVSSNVVVSGNTDVQSELNVAGNVYVSSNAIITGNTDVQSELNVAGNAYVSSNVVVSGNTDVQSELNVAGNVYVSSNAIITGNTDVQSELNVAGNVYVSSNVVVSGNTDVQSELNVAGNVYVSSNVVVSGNTDVQSELNVAGNVYVSSNAIITGNTDVQSELNVAGNVYVSSNANIEGTLNLNNATTALITDITSNDQVKHNKLKRVNISEL